MEDLREKLFRMAAGELPSGFLKSLLRVLPSIYKESHGRSFDDPAWGSSEGHDVCGHIRRALTESQFKKLAKNHGLRYKTMRNRKRTSYYSVVFAGRLVLTESAVQHKGQNVRSAAFRAQHRALNAALAQRLLFESDGKSPALDEPGDVYAILTHGPDSKSGQDLGFVEICFPLVDSDVPIRINLLDIVRAQSSTEGRESTIEDQARPKLKRIRKPNQE